MPKFNGITTKTHFVNVIIRQYLFDNHITNIKYEDTWDIAKYLSQKYPDQQFNSSNIKAYIDEWSCSKQ